MFARLARVVLFAVLLACLGLPSPVEADSPSNSRVRRGWDYTVEPNAELTKIRVTICFRRFLPRRLILSEAGARRALTFAPSGGPGAGTLRNEPGGEGVLPVGVAPGGCIAYDVDVKQLEWGWRGWKAARVGRDLMLRPGLFMLRPAVWPDGVYVTMRFVCPGGLNAIAPWAQVVGSTLPHHYTLSQHGLQLDGVLAMGRFTTESVRTATTNLAVVRMDRQANTTKEDVATWIRAAAEAVAPLYGRFPTPYVQVLVHPVAPSATPVVFGRAMRPGGAAAIFYVSATASAETMVGEWVGVHELLHLGMPWTYPTEAWYQEGFVTYYQEVMRARAGFNSPEAGWGELVSGFGRGARGGGGTTLAQASSDMHRSHAYWRVYWGGATIALLIDLELRRVFQGRRSLDDVMRHLYRRFGAERKTVHRGLDLLAEADRFLGRPVCVPIARQVLAETKQRDLRSVYRTLGVTLRGGQVVLEPSAPRAADARAIMTPTKRR